MGTESAQLALAWKAAAVSVPEGPEKALAFGRRFRINVRQALKACLLTAKAYFAGKVAVLTGDVTPHTILGIGADAFAAVVAVLDAIREKIKSPLKYLACVVLSEDPDGLAAEEFRARLTNLLEQLTAGNGGGQPLPLPWYLAVRDTDAQVAKNEWGVGNEYANLLESLVASRDVERTASGTFRYVDRNFEWGFSGGAE